MTNPASSRHVSAVISVVMVLATAPPARAVVLRAGEVVVADRGGPGRPGGLVRVGRPTGGRTKLSDFGDPEKGPGATDATGVALERVDRALIADTGGPTDGGQLLRVNVEDGTRAVLSDFEDATQGPLGKDPAQVAVERSGQIVTLDTGAGTDDRGALFRVDAASGARTLLSDFGDGAQGPLGRRPTGLALEGSGDILVTDETAGLGNGVVFRVNRTSGNRTVLSDFADTSQGPPGGGPVGVAVESSGDVLVADRFSGTNESATIIRVDPTSGDRTRVSDFGNPEQGPTGSFLLSGVSVDDDGQILVVDPLSGTDGQGALFEVDPMSGGRTQLSDFGDPSEGPILRGFGLIVVQQSLVDTTTTTSTTTSRRPPPRRLRRRRPARPRPPRWRRWTTSSATRSNRAPSQTSRCRCRTSSVLSPRPCGRRAGSATPATRMDPASRTRQITSPAIG